MKYSAAYIKENIRKNPNPRIVVLENNKIPPLFLKALKVNAVMYHTKPKGNDMTEFRFNVSSLSKAARILSKYIEFGPVGPKEMLFEQ